MISEAAKIALNWMGFWVCNTNQNGTFQTFRNSLPSVYLEEEMETGNEEQRKQIFFAVIHLHFAASILLR